MPLDPLQDLITRTALSLPEAHTLALAGGAAMTRTDSSHASPTTWTCSPKSTTARPCWSPPRCAPHSNNSASPPPTPSDHPSTHRFVAVDPASGQECLVEVFADGGRLQQRVTLDIGSVLHPDDLAADKVLALWGRARPRDFFDVHALLQLDRPSRLLELAAAKDAGFTADTFLDALNAIKRLTPQDWAEDGIEANVIDDLRFAFAEWHHALAATEAG